MLDDDLEAPQDLPDYAERVLAIVDKLAPGTVATYGEVAAEAGTGPRQVGSVLRKWGGSTNWWRVVRADGSGHDPIRQVPLWDAEGIAHDGHRVKF